MEKLAEQGWEFRSDYWESGHNGDPYDDVEFKSPNMVGFKRISEHDWKERTTLDSLLKTEAGAVAEEWVKKVFEYEWDGSIQSKMVEAVKKYLLSKKSTQFEKLSYNDDAETTVKVSPKNIHKPKHIKITIEIT